MGDHDRPESLITMGRNTQVKVKEDLVDVLESDEGLEILSTVILTASIPLHHPALLEQYKKVDPEFPRRVLAQVEKEQAHRHSLENRKLEATVDITRRGQTFGLAIAVLAIAVAFLSALLGHNEFAIAIVTVMVVSLVSVFVLRRRPKRTETED